MDLTEEPSWMRARRGINLLLNDKNQEAEDLFQEDPQNIHMTAGICYVTFLNAVLCFDDGSVADAIAQIKKIEEQCASQIGWMKSIKNRIFYFQSHTIKPLEQTLEEKIVLADSLVCQSFLIFLRNDFTSYMKGGWTLRKAWKIYQQTYEQLSTLHKHIFGYPASGLSQCDKFIGSDIPTSPTTTKDSYSTWSVCENEHSDSGHATVNNGQCNSKIVPNQDMYSCTSKTISDFTGIVTNENKKHSNSRNESISSSTNNLSNSSSSLRPNSSPLNNGSEGLMRKSVSLFSSINNFGSAIYESATSLIGLKKDSIQESEVIGPEAVLRLMSAVCFGYGIFRLCVSLAPSYILKWMNMLGFEGDQNVAVESLNYSRKGNDMRAPIASLVLLWYHTVVRPFFNTDSEIVSFSINEAAKILREEKEFENSALFLFFLGRVERIKPNIQGAIKAYEQSVANASITDVKLLGLHEVGWCHLLILDYKQAHKCFSQLRQQSKWSKSFYSYMATINAGACSNTAYVLQGKKETMKLLNTAHKSAQIDQYIKNRVDCLPEPNQDNKELVNDKVYWQLYCFEMLYLWNTLPSCAADELLTIIKVCTPIDGKNCVKYEPMLGISWLMKGAATVVLANQTKIYFNGEDGITHQEDTTDQLLDDAVEAFRKCLKIRTNSSNHVHISAFAQYELALLLLRNDDTRPEGKVLLMKSQSQYKDFDFEQRLNVRISNTLNSVEKYERERGNSKA